MKSSAHTGNINCFGSSLYSSFLLSECLYFAFVTDQGVEEDPGILENIEETLSEFSLSTILAVTLQCLRYSCMTEL